MTPSPAAVAWQRVVADAELLADGPERIELLLPTGEQVTAAREDVERRAPGDLAWRGRIEGYSGQVTLTLKHGLVAGLIWVGDAAYEVRPLPDWGHSVELLDHRLFPECAGAIAPDEESLGHGALSDAGLGFSGSSPGWPEPTRTAGESEHGESGPDSTVMIDLLSVYTPQARDAAGGVAQIETTIQAAVDNSNTSFINSGMTARFNMVHMALANRNDTGDMSSDLGWVRTDAAVASLRDTYAADMVSLIVNNGGGGCGIGYVMRNPGPAFAPWAFQVTARHCAVGNLTFVHEHGHNMGLEHNPENGPDPGTASYPWSFGHWHNGRYRTVMSYANPCTSGCTRLAYFSNPAVTPPGHAGFPSGIADQRDNHRSGNLTAPIVAAFRHGVPPGSFNLISPAAGATVGTGSVLLSWQSASAAASYDVYFGASNPPPFVANQAGTTRSVTVADGQLLYWRVVARNAQGTQENNGGVRWFAASADTALVSGIPVVVADPRPRGTFRYYFLDVPIGATDLSFAISGGSGDADLYVRRAAKPTSAQYDCRPRLAGNTESCDFPSPQAGRWWIGLAVWDPYSGVSLTGAFTLAQLEPMGLAVDELPGGGSSGNLNGILEPGETVSVAPSWHNPGQSGVAVTGLASGLTGPGSGYALVDAVADYGAIPAGGTANCGDATGNCYQVSLAVPATRPALHWDLTFTETLSTGEVKTWTIHVGDSFADVGVGHWAYGFIETLLHSGITAGCGGWDYCPTDTLNRWQMGVFLAKAMVGDEALLPDSGTVPGLGNYTCGAGGTSVFGDVPPTDPACRHIHYTAAQEVTAGCGGGLYCPAQQVTRWQMGVFLAKAMVGDESLIPASGVVPGMGSYSCGIGNASVFADISPGDPVCRHIHYIAAEGVTVGCGGGLYCPDHNLSRDQMAVFLAKAFELALD